MTPEELYIRIKESKSINPNFKGVPLELLQNFHISELILNKYGIKKLNKKQQRSLNLDAVAANCNDFYLKFNIPELLSALPKNISKDLIISGTQIKKIKVKSVNGSLMTYSSTKCLFENLEKVGEDINFSNCIKNSLPRLKSVGGSLTVYKTELDNFDSLVEIGGHLDISEIRNVQFPKLEKVIGGMCFTYTGVNNLSNLVSVGGDFFGIGHTAIRNLPKLESVGGELDLRAVTFRELPALRNVGSILAYSNTYTNADYWRRYFIQTGRPEIAEKIKEERKR